MKLIDKIALIYVKDKRILCTLSKGKDIYYLPGGKREKDESDTDTLIRECKECQKHIYKAQADLEKYNRERSRL